MDLRGCRPWVVLLVATALLPVPGTAEPVAEDPYAAARERFERSVGPLDPAVHRPAAPSAGRNAADAYLAGARQLAVTLDESGRLAAVLGQNLAAWSPADRQWVGELAAREATALAQVRRGAERSGALFPASEALTREELAGLIRGARLLLSVALVEPPPPAGGADPIATLGTLARHLQGQPEMLYQLLGLSVESDFLRGLGHVLADPAADPRRLRALARLLAAPSAREAFARTLAYEASLGAGLALGPVPEASAGAPGHDLAARISLLDAYREMAEAAREPGRFVALVEAGTGAGEPATTGAVVTALVMPNFVEGLRKLQATAGARELAAAALRLRLAALDTGAYPAAAPPVIDPVTGAGSTYRVRPDGSALLANPAAAAAWQEHWGGVRTTPPPFAHHLPRPGSGEATPPAPPCIDP